jgi:hypothetical protein
MILGKIRSTFTKVKVVFTVVLIMAVIGVFIYDRGRSNRRTKNANYIKGISLGIVKTSRGSSYLDYEFKVNDSTYNGSVSGGFCNQCPKCGIKGDTVFVRYEKNNPINSDLVTAIPQ